MKQALLGLSIALFSLNVAATEQCFYGDQAIPLGESISLKDPFLMDEMANYYVAKGVKEADALEMAQNSDWTLIVLECMYSYKPATKSNDTIAFGMVEVSEPVLVPLSHQVEWVMEYVQERN